METPFVFGKIASGFEFTDREKETRQLTTNFNSGINCILISPRRWGKSSLVFKAAAAATKKNDKLKSCFIDLFNIKSEEEFYQILAREVLRSCSTKLEDTLSNAKKFLGRFIPKLTFSPDPLSDFSLALDWKEVKENPDQILNMAEKIAMEKKIKLVICIDEFQNIAEFSNPLAFQKKLRANWQKHKHVHYCLYGSKRHMMMEVFSAVSMPFYKFGELIFLDKIKTEDWITFITDRFKNTGKKIGEENAKLIATLTECHSYYVQQLAQQCWLRSNKTCSEAIVLEAHDTLLRQLSLLFQNITDNLSSPQVNYLRALTEGAEKLSSKEMLAHYHLGTSANVNRIKEALINKEIIDIYNQKTEFLDPVYKSWLKKYYFISGLG